MTDIRTKTMTARGLAQEFRTLFREELSDRISDVDLASYLINSNFFAVRDAADQELFFATSDYLDAFLNSVVASTVTFNESRLGHWAKEATLFARNNVKHEAFTEIFSSRVQYEQVLFDLLKFDASGSFIVDYFQQVHVDSAFIADTLPRPFQEAVQTAAKDAIHPALVALSHLLVKHERLGKPSPAMELAAVTALKRSTSFLNEKGKISFSENCGRFKISQSSEADKLAQY